MVKPITQQGHHVSGLIELLVPSDAVAPTPVVR
jgi:hypothetical protein